MAKKSGVNKSAAFRDLLAQNPEIKAAEAVAKLAEKGIKSDVGLFYFVKGHMKGMKGRRRKIRRKVATAMTNGEGTTASGTGDVLATIRKVKGWASDVGGLKKLKALVDALSE